MVIITITCLDHCTTDKDDKSSSHVEFIGRFEKIDKNYLYLQSVSYDDDADVSGSLHKAIYQLVRAMTIYLEPDDIPEEINDMKQEIEAFFKKHDISYEISWPELSNE